MKKFMLFASALAGLFLAASCQQENLEPVGKGNTVTFTVEAPAALQTKAIADGMNVDELIYEVWITDGQTNDLTGAQKLYQSSTEMFKEDGKNKATVTLDLVNDQNYTVLFWAQVAAADAYITEDLTAVTYAKAIDAYAANDESLAAFYAVSYIDDDTAVNQTVYLTRPFAQVNLCTLNSKAAAQQAGDYNIAIVNSKMTLKNVPTEFNVATGDVDGYAEFEFTYAPVPSAPATIKVSEKEYYYAGMNYVFAGDNLELTYDIQTSLNGSTNYAVVNNVISSVPVKKNYRTNIVGNLLTSKTDYEIIVDAEFEAPEYVLGEEWSQAGAYNYTVNEGASATVLAEVLAHADAEAKAAATKAAGPEVKITLNGDVEWETGAGIGSTPLLPEDSPISAVVINGNGKTFTATGKGVGQIRLANGALLTFNNVKVVDLSVSYAENSWEYGYLEFGGNLAFNECQFVNAIMMESENAAFTNCSFNSNKDNEYAVWVNEGNTTFNGCTFTGARGLKIHEAYGSEVASVVVDGCTFGPLTMKPGIALGDLNAETSVTIKNSTFDGCQAGDQKLYMYETDTDVTTFTFVTENNTVVPSGDEVIEQGEGVVMVATAAGFAKAIEEAEAGDVILVAGSVVLPSGVITSTPGALTIEGYTEDAEVAFNSTAGGADGGLNCYADGMDLLFKNITVVSPNTGSAYSGGFGRAKSVTFENCEYIGQYRAVNAYTKFIDCTIDPQTSYIYTDYANVDFTGCTFNCSEGKGVQVYNDGNTTNTVINVTDCTFAAAKQGATWDGKPVTAIDINSNGEIFTVNITNTTATGFPEGLATASTLFNIKGGAEYVTVMIDGMKFIASGMYEDEQGKVVVATAAGLTAALNAKTPYIVLLPGVYEGTFYMQSNITIEGQDGAVVHCICLNRADGVTLKNIEFDAAGAKFGYDGKGTQKVYAYSNIITGDDTKKINKGAHNLVIDGCTFTGKFANPGAPISFTDQNRGEGGSGNITIKNCVFENTNANYTIYAHYTGDSINGHGDFVIENNTFSSSCYAGPIYLGRYASSTPVVLKGNTFETVTSLDDAIYVQDHSSYGVSVDASDNTFAN